MSLTRAAARTDHPHAAVVRSGAGQPGHKRLSGQARSSATALIHQEALPCLK